MEKKFYQIYFKDEILTMLKKCNNKVILEMMQQIGNESSCANIPIKRADSIRIEHMADNIGMNKEFIFEFVQLGFVKNIIKAINKYDNNDKNDKNDNTLALNVYTLIQMNKSSIPQKNKHVQQFVQTVISSAIIVGGGGGGGGSAAGETAGMYTMIRKIVENAPEYIEKNKYIIQYADVELYQHQKKLFSVFNNKKKDSAQLILYMAPTGTGKTMSPLGLAQYYKVIFVCVARHVGLALARSAISMHKKVAFAFGCDSAGDIRLHYFSAKEYTKNKRSGMIQKVDNAVGDKVEIMICDIKSYLCAMYYMIQFHPLDEIVTYWDEPTITLDIENHPLHKTISSNWQGNKIPNMVLSCATLPREDEILDVIEDFRQKFDNVEIHTISSFESKKSVSLVTKEGYMAAPHNMFPKYSDLLDCAKHCEENKILLKYIDLQEASKFITFVNKEGYLNSEKLKLEYHFQELSDVTMNSVKMYYFAILQEMPAETWPQLYNSLVSLRVPAFTLNATPTSSVPSSQIHIQFAKNVSVDRAASRNEGAKLSRTISVPVQQIGPIQQIGSIQSTPQITGILLTTSDAFTLNDGPTIYLTEDVDKIAKFYIQQSKIPELLLTRIHESISKNNTLNREIDKLTRDIDDILAKDVLKETKLGKDHRLPPTVIIMRARCESLRSQVDTVSLDKSFIPNTREHQMKWTKQIHPNSFVSNLDDDIVAQIVNLSDVSSSWKILLLMGIGVFSSTIVGGSSISESATASVAVAATISTDYLEIMKKLAYEQKLYLIIAGSDFVFGTNYSFCHGIIGRDLCNMTQQKTIQCIGRVGRAVIQQTYTVRFRDDEILRNLFLPSSNVNLEAVNMCKLFATTTTKP